MRPQRPPNADDDSKQPVAETNASARLGAGGASGHLAASDFEEEKKEEKVKSPNWATVFAVLVLAFGLHLGLQFFGLQSFALQSFTLQFFTLQNFRSSV